jgi:hypothetical protein
MGDYEDDEFEDYDDDDFEDDDPESPKKVPPPKKSAEPTLPAPKNSAEPVRPNAGQSAARQSKVIDPKVLEMQRAMAKENQAAAAKNAGGVRSSTRQAPVRQSQVPMRQSQARGSAVSQMRESKDGKNRASKESPLPERKRVNISLAAGSPKQGGGKFNQSDAIALAKHRRQRYEEFIQSGAASLKQSMTMMLFDLSPMTPYQLYARGMSRATRESTGVQCPDDEPVGLSDDVWDEWQRRNSQKPVAKRSALPRHSIDTQTPEITRANVAMQCPEDLGTRSRHEKEKQREKAKTLVHTDQMVNLIGQDTSRLSCFVQHVEPVFSALLTENINNALRKKDSVCWRACAGGGQAGG